MENDPDVVETLKLEGKVYVICCVPNWYEVSGVSANTRYSV